VRDRKVLQRIFTMQRAVAFTEKADLVFDYKMEQKENGSEKEGLDSGVWMAVLCDTWIIRSKHP
jgi:hypothetical protein